MSTTIYPTYRFVDAPAMMEWLERAFGFRRHAVHVNDDGTVAHAEMALGDALIMFGSVQDNHFARLIGAPGERRVEAQCVYVAVPDVDALCERARKARARIVMEPTDQPYGSRDFVCRDPEGNIWCFGTYQPKAPEA